MERTKKSLPLLPRSIIELIVSFASNEEQRCTLEFIDILHALEEEILNNALYHCGGCAVTHQQVIDLFALQRNCCREIINERRNLKNQLPLESYYLLTNSDSDEE